MGQRLRVGVMGAGSIGCYVGGKLLAADAADVLLVGRARLAAELAAHGLRVKDLAREPVHVPAERAPVATAPDALGNCDAVLVCVKSAQTGEVGRRLAEILPPGTLVASLQNGIRNAEVLRDALPEHTVIPGIVGFNVVSRGEGLFHRTMSGPITLQASNHRGQRGLARALAESGLDVDQPADIAPDQWTKLLVNLNNAVSALSGAPTREILLSPGYRRIVAAVVEEGLRVLRAARIRPASLRGVPVGFMPTILRMPTPIVRLVTGAQMRVDPEARSSMWEDLTRGRPTEVDALNGEIVRLAERVSASAPLNARIVELVHQAEREGQGSPGLSADALWTRLESSAAA